MKPKLEKNISFLECLPTILAYYSQTRKYKETQNKKLKKENVSYREGHVIA
jgi:hypothetical protein